MKKIIRLTESDLTRIVKRTIEEMKVAGFGDMGDDWYDESDRPVRDKEIYNLADPEEWDTEEFTDFDELKSKHPENKWFGQKSMFDKYQEMKKRPFKVKSRKNRD